MSEFNNFDITNPHYINRKGQFRPPNRDVLLMAIRWAKENHSSNEPFPIGEWDVSMITDMSNLFSEWKDFNRDISNWDVSNVTRIFKMFNGCTSFNQPLNSWGDKLGNVSNMEEMFNGCTSFNQPLNTWDVSKVTIMLAMFDGCTSFNQPIGDWNVSNVISMSSMFNGCTSFNQPLNTWNVSNVTRMYKMFYGCTSFNQPLGDWNVSKVNIMNEMFKGCTSFNQPLNSWGERLNNLRDASSMFNGCTSFNQPLNRWILQSRNPQGRWTIVLNDNMVDNTDMTPENLPSGLVRPPIYINQKVMSLPTTNTGNLVVKIIDNNDNECPICMDPITNDVCYTEQCKHLFHFKCLAKHCNNKRQCECPLCRTPIHFASITGGKLTRKQRQGGKRTRQGGKRTKQRQTRGGKRTRKQHRKPRRGKSRRYVVL